jgi:hypothetical protein
LTGWLDEYERKARLIPGLVAVLPVAFAVVGLGLRSSPVIALLVGVGSSVGLPVVLANYVRHQGQMLQDRLFSKWDGSPALRRLRHRGDDSKAYTRDRLRGHVSEITRLTLPDETAETGDPEKADAIYADAVNQVIRRTRDKKQFRLLFEENKNYGFARNLLAMRRVGLAISAASCAALGTGVVLTLTGVTHGQLTNTVVGAAVDALWVIGWMAVPSEDQVHRAGEAYADRLFEASWVLEPGAAS